MEIFSGFALGCSVGLAVVFGCTSWFFARRADRWERIAVSNAEAADYYRSQAESGPEAGDDEDEGDYRGG